MEKQEGYGRFIWIHKVIDSYRWAIQNEITGGNNRDININNLMHELSSRLIKLIEEQNCLNKTLIKNNFLNDSVYFIYHLERELLDENFEIYRRFNINHESRPSFIEVFKFVGFFYLIEHWINLLIYTQSCPIPKTHMNTHDEIIKFLLNFIDFFPYPFNLIIKKENGKYIWLNDINCIEKHKSFAQNREINYYEIINKSYRETFKKIIKKRSKRNKKKKELEKDQKICFYDIFWIYSESLRYHLVLPKFPKPNYPFYWNMNIRWLIILLSEVFEYLMINILPFDEIFKFDFLTDIQKERLQIINNYKLGI